MFINTVVPAGCTARINVFGKTVSEVSDGEYSFEVPVPADISFPFSCDTPNIDIMAFEPTKSLLKKYLYPIYAACEKGSRAFLLETVRSCAIAFGIDETDENFSEYENKIRRIKA